MASSGDKLGGSGAGKEAGTFLRSFGKHVRGCPSKHQPVDRKRAAWSVLLLCAHGASHLQAQKETPVPTNKKLDKHSNCTEIRANTDSGKTIFRRSGARTGSAIQLYRTAARAPLASATRLLFLYLGTIYAEHVGTRVQRLRCVRSMCAMRRRRRRRRRIRTRRRDRCAL